MAKDAKGHGSNVKGGSIDSRITSSQAATGPRYSQARWSKAKADFGKAEKAFKTHGSAGNAKGARDAMAAMSDARVRMAAESTKGRR